MTRTPDSNTDKLNKLYEEKLEIEKDVTFLNTKLGLLDATLIRTNIDSVRQNRIKTLEEIKVKTERYIWLQNEIDSFEDM